MTLIWHARSGYIIFSYYEKLDHMPSSRHNGSYGKRSSIVRTLSKPHQCWRRDRVWDRLSTLTPTISYHRRRYTASEHRVGRGMAHSVRAMYSARLALFINGITSAKRTREVRPAVLVRESSTQLNCIRIRWIHASDTLHILYRFLSLRKALWRPCIFWQLPHKLHHRFHHTLHYNYLITTEK